MNKLEEFDCVIYLSSLEESEEDSRLREMGIEVPNKPKVQDEKIVKYSFDMSNITEVRQTFVEYNEEWEPAVCVRYLAGDIAYETPPLVISYQKFKERLDEYNNKKELKAQ